MTRTWLIPLVLILAGCGTAPVEPARQVASVRSSWGAPDEASVAAVRRIVVTTRPAAASNIARCEAHASRAAYIRCALPTLARLGSSGEMNAMMLLRLSGGTRPSSGCLALIHSLAGAESNLGTVARGVLREELVRGPRWAEVARAADSIRALAAVSGGVASSTAWRSGCAVEFT